MGFSEMGFGETGFGEMGLNRQAKEYEQYSQQ